MDIEKSAEELTEAWANAASKVIEAEYRIKKMSDGKTPWIWFIPRAHAASSLAFATRELVLEAAKQDYLQRNTRPSVEEMWAAIRAEFPDAYAVCGYSQLWHVFSTRANNYVVLGAGETEEDALQSTFSRLRKAAAPAVIAEVEAAEAGQSTEDQVKAHWKDDDLRAVYFDGWWEIRSGTNGSSRTFGSALNESEAWLDALNRIGLAASAKSEEQSAADAELDSQLRENGINPEELMRNACSRFITEASAYISRGERVPPKMLTAIHQFTAPEVPAQGEKQGEAEPVTFSSGDAAFIRSMALRPGNLTRIEERRVERIVKVLGLIERSVLKKELETFYGAGVARADEKDYYKRRKAHICPECATFHAEPRWPYKPAPAQGDGEPDPNAQLRAWYEQRPAIKCVQCGVMTRDDHKCDDMEGNPRCVTYLYGEMLAHYMDDGQFGEPHTFESREASEWRAGFDKGVEAHATELAAAHKRISELVSAGDVLYDAVEEERMIRAGLEGSFSSPESARVAWAKSYEAVEAALRTYAAAKGGQAHGT